MPTETQPTTPTTRTRRPDGMENMVDATVRLLQDRSPEQITVRDVAEASGHHHRFVQAWFGGKVGLFRAVFDRMTEASAERLRRESMLPQPFGPDVRMVITLMNWLVAAEPGALDGPRPTPIIDQVTDTYHELYGLDRDLARLMALRMVGASIAAVLFPGPMGVTSDDVAAVAALERDLAVLLAADRDRAT